MGLSNFDGEKEEGEGGGGHTKGGLGLVVPPLIFTSYVFPLKREKEVEGDTHGVACREGIFFFLGGGSGEQRIAISRSFLMTKRERRKGEDGLFFLQSPLFLLFYFFLWSTWKSSQWDTVVFLRRGIETNFSTIPKLLFLSKEVFFL